MPARTFEIVVRGITIVPDTSSRTKVVELEGVSEDNRDEGAAGGRRRCPARGIVAVVRCAGIRAAWRRDSSRGARSCDRRASAARGCGKRGGRRVHRRCARDSARARRGHRALPWNRRFASGDFAGAPAIGARRSHVAARAQSTHGACAACSGARARDRTGPAEHTPGADGLLTPAIYLLLRPGTVNVLFTTEFVAI